MIRTITFPSTKALLLVFKSFKQLFPVHHAILIFRNAPEMEWIDHGRMGQAQKGKMSDFIGGWIDQGYRTVFFSAGFPLFYDHLHPEGHFLFQASRQFIGEDVQGRHEYGNIGIVAADIGQFLLIAHFPGNEMKERHTDGFGQGR